MDSQLLLQILLSATGAGVLGAIINGIINRKKLGAEATNIITQAATGVVDRLEKEIERKSGDLANARERIRQLEERVRVVEAREASHANECREERQRRFEEMLAIRETLQVHAAWDFRAIQRLEEFGMRKTDLRPPPPLLPPDLMLRDAFEDERGE